MGQIRLISIKELVLPALSLLTPLAGHAADTASVASSSAYGIGAEFTSGDIATSLDPIGGLAFEAPPAYNKSAAVPSVQQSLVVVSGNRPIPTLFVNATGIKSHVASNGIQIDFVAAEGDAAVKSVDLTLILNPPPPGPPPVPPIPFPQPFLSLSATKIASTASFNHTFPAGSFATGSASLGSLVVSGSLVGYQTLKFSGNVPKNTVLFKSPTVTVTLNQQIVAGLVSCQMACTVAATGITTDAVHISLHDADIGGHLVSGELVLGRSYAD